MNSEKYIPFILVVDDDDIVRQSMKFILEDLGAVIKECRNGRSAVKYFRENHDKIDLVILDLIMPGITGLECYNMLKEIKSDVNVVISSGYLCDNQKEILAKEGIRGFLPKPFGVEDLANIIEMKLGARS